MLSHRSIALIATIVDIITLSFVGAGWFMFSLVSVATGAGCYAFYRLSGTINLREYGETLHYISDPFFRYV